MLCVFHQSKKTGKLNEFNKNYEVNDFNIFPFHAERGHEKVTVETSSRQETILYILLFHWQELML